MMSRRSPQMLSILAKPWSLLAALGIASAALPATASAQGAMTDDALLRDTAEYAADQGIDMKEAQRRLALQHDIGELNEALSDELVDRFAGLWIQHAPEFRVIVQLTEGDEDVLWPYLAGSPLDSMVELRPAWYTLAELEAAQDRALALAHAAQVPVEAGINVFDNTVELYVTDQGITSSTFQGLRAQLPYEVDVVTVPQLSQPVAYVYGGLALSTCTSGFSVRNSSGTKGITTAAHCGNSQSYGSISLTFRAESYNGSSDVQWHTASGHTIRNWAYDGLNDSSTPYYRVITGTKSRSSQSINEFVCKYGKTTKYGCGYIIDKSYKSSHVPNSNSTFIRVSRDGVDLSEGGDSGGPWFYGGTAYGTMVSQIGNDAVYMAINYISSLGLSVLTN